jgi:Tol biopolymer transport system component
MSEQQQDRLESWKEIGAYLQRDARTVRRWEKEEGLPVHRHGHKRGSSVYAYPSEIDAWRASRKVAAEPPPPRPLWKMPAFAVTMALCLVMVGNGLRPQTASAQGTAPTARRVWAPGGWNQVSLDGRYIPTPLSIHDLVTGTDRPLPPEEFGEASVLSPDNSQLVYVHFDDERRSYVLRHLSLQGANQKPRNLTRGDPPLYSEPKGWTPDGKELLVTQKAPDGIWRIEMMSVADGTVRVLKSLKWGEPDARISPDGRFIAYSTPSEGRPNSDIFLLATDGSSESPAVRHAANDYGMIWSPDGSKILFLSDRTGSPSLWFLPVKEGKPAGAAELVKTDVGSSLLGMGRNGVLYYYVRGRNNVYRAELNSEGKVSQPPVIATDSFVNANRGGDISPDGERIAYYSYRPRPTLVIKTLKTGEERVVATTMAIASIYFRGPQWFPDGRSVLVDAHENDRPNTIHYRVDVATGRVEEILRGTPGFLFTPAPAGNVIYSKEADRDRLVRHDLATGRSEEVVSSVRAGSFSVSPDGRRIAYLAWPPGPERYIAIIPANGGQPREIYRGVGGRGPSNFNTLEWSPDQKYVLFVEEEGDGSAIWRVPVAGGAAERIGVTMNARIKAPFVHPDGKSMFFTAVEADNNEVWALENFLPATGK